MYKDVITYRLAAGVTEEKLMSVAGQIVQDWMMKLDGFISWEIMKNEDDSYSDIVSWQDHSAAQNAEKEMVNIPNAGEWFACYQEGSISTKKLSRLALFGD